MNTQPADQKVMATIFCTTGRIISIAHHVMTTNGGLAMPYTFEGGKSQVSTNYPLSCLNTVPSPAITPMYDPCITPASNGAPHEILTIHTTPAKVQESGPRDTCFGHIPHVCFGSCPLFAVISPRGCRVRCLYFPGAGTLGVKDQS